MQSGLEITTFIVFILIEGLLGCALFVSLYMVNYFWFFFLLPNITLLIFLKNVMVLFSFCYANS